MEAIKLQLANQTLLNPAASQWQRAPQVNVTLRGTEAQAQPSAYVRTVWAGKRIGAVRAVTVRAAHNRQTIFFRLEWADPTHNADFGDGSVFPDAAAVLFADNADVPIARMGAPGQPIHGWYWRANTTGGGEHLRFEGLATEERVEPQNVVANAAWESGRWAVVVGAPVESAGRKLGLAVWEGSNQERAGLHSFTPMWMDLEIK